jgi:hypothetical protein
VVLYYGVENSKVPYRGTSSLQLRKYYFGARKTIDYTDTQTHTHTHKATSVTFSGNAI